ncbi:MAG: translation initiation factor IF-3 [Candidatus Magasanikbacteria bacterium]|nr:translation initiation factor IF-3 [Candidatus Magasanikbacteria bacterium]
MRITHRRKKEEPKKMYRSNEQITAPQVLVLNESGGNLGIMPTAKAIQAARAAAMDLVEINPKIDPPVCKMMDFGQFRYQQEKEARLAKAHQHVVETKGVRLSLRIGKNDIDIRKNQTIKFLNDGNKVKIELMMRGREQQQISRAMEVVRQFVNDITAIHPVRFEQAIERQANKITAIIAKA